MCTIRPDPESSVSEFQGSKMQTSSVFCIASCVFALVCGSTVGNKGGRDLSANKWTLRSAENVAKLKGRSKMMVLDSFDFGICDTSF